MIKYIQHRYKNNQNYFQGIALPGPRCPLYLFSEKDAAAIANSMRQNKVRRFRLLTPFCRPATSANRIRAPSSPARCAAGQPVRPYYGRHLFFPM